MSIWYGVVGSDKVHRCRCRPGRHCSPHVAYFQVLLPLCIIMAHLTHHSHRRQTLAFKGFIVSGCTLSCFLQPIGSKSGSAVTIFGLVFGAESALIEHENIRRREENILRREARLDLARRGLVGTETEIANWKAAREQAFERGRRPWSQLISDHEYERWYLNTCMSCASTK